MHDRSPPSAAPFRPVVIAPTYNNAGTLVSVLRRVETVGLPLIVVNDGSTDGAAERLREWEFGPHAGEVRVLTHSRNRGKADALRRGFAAAAAAGRTHAVTIDTDGQLDP